jgi:protease-4
MPNPHRSLAALALIAALHAPAPAQGFLDIFAPKVTKVEEEVVSGDAAAQHKILLIHINGIITSSTDGGLAPRMATPDRLRWQLEKAAKDPWVRGIILEINSPGGEVTASDVMYRLVKEMRASKKVVALMGDIAASGGYYIAAGAERILAHPTTITGSIGVIMHGANMSGLLEKLGVKLVTIKSTTTPMKDILSPAREMTPEEKKLLEDILDDMYARFASVVGDSRKLKPEQVRQLADGRIYTASQALKNGLIDEIGYREDAVKAVTKLAKMPSAKLIRYKKPVNFLEALGGVENMFQNISGWLSEPTTLLEQALPKFMYLVPLGH